jgi:hypothetical protein
MAEKITIKRAEDFADMAGAYQDDFGKWIFRESDYLCKFADIVLASCQAEVNTLKSTIEMLKTDLGAAEVEIQNLRVK